MKTPEEIKIGLEYASTTNIAKKVMLAKAGKMPYAYMEEVASDALAYIHQLEEALLLMVYQYCDEGDGSVNHRYMAAGEHAFAALGIENGCSIEQIEKMMDEMDGVVDES